MDRIIENLYLGDRNDAEMLKRKNGKTRRGWKIIATVDYPYNEIPYEPIDAVVVAVLNPVHKGPLIEDGHGFTRCACFESDGIANMDGLNLVAVLVQEYLEQGFKVLIHCVGSIDRSPFATAWTLTFLLGLYFDDAYKLVEKIHPQTRRHEHWLPKEFRGDIPTAKDFEGAN